MNQKQEKYANLLLRLILPVVFNALAVPANAQTIVFDYDNGGNRIKRELAVPAPQPKRTKTSRANPEALLTQSEQIKIGPSPTTGIVKVEISNFCTDNMGLISVYNTSGQLILKAKASTPVTEVNIGNRPGGVYIFNVEAAKARACSMIIKQ